MNIFGNTKHRLAELAHELANTTRLAVDINCAVDRVEGELKAALARLDEFDYTVANLSDEMMAVGGKIERLEARLEKSDAINRAATSLHVTQISELRDDLQKTINLTGAAGRITDERVSEIEQRVLGVNRSDELAARWDGVLEKEFGAEAVAERHLGAEQPERPARRVSVGVRAIRYATDRLTAGQPILTKEALGGRKLGGKDRMAIRCAFRDLGLVRAMSDPECWVAPDPQPRDQMTRDERGPRAATGSASGGLRDDRSNATKEGPSYPGGNSPGAGG